MGESKIKTNAKKCFCCQRFTFSTLQTTTTNFDMYNNIFSEKVLYHVLISIAVVAIYSGTPEKMKQNQKKSNPNSNYLPYIGSINLFFSYQNRLHFDRIYVQ